MKSGAKTKKAAPVRQPATTTRPLTRGQVAERLGVSVASVRRMEGKSLHPTIEGASVRHFDPAEVEAVKGTLAATPKKSAPSDGALHAKAFRLFREKREFDEIVIELEQPPAVVRGLYRDWQSGFENPRTRAEPTNAGPVDEVAEYFRWSDEQRAISDREFEKQLEDQARRLRVEAEKQADRISAKKLAKTQRENAEADQKRCRSEALERSERENEEQFQRISGDIDRAIQSGSALAALPLLLKLLR